ncbi:MAG TPA: molybdopterin molybdotransferase MoeA [Thermodesulfobacteriota bacterium]|nr:molybdopterin molybdotransferase MoeA [Thermodesulfobacteriota bacterium]
MISFDKARSIVLSHTHPMGREKVDLLTALGRVIGENVIAPFNIPPWDNSAMDGYAVRFEDIKDASPNRPISLKVIEELPAGFLPAKKVGPKQATHIMTGAPIPQGADTVVMKEDTSTSEDSVKILHPSQKGRNIRLTGENVKRGDKVISAGTTLRPPHIGMLASFSKSFVLVYQVPKVAILSTGDEVIDIDEKGDTSKIINSNSYSLAALVKECGALPLILGIARDDKREISAKITQGLSADVILTTGGVSVGEYDFVKDVLEEMGGEIKFWKVAMRPGSPTAFGLIADKLIFGLPGNPVSCMVCFEQFVRPALLKKMGHTHLFRPQVEAVLLDDVETKKDLRFFIRVRLGFREGVLCATTTGDQGSGILKSMIQANGLMVVTEDKQEIMSGEKVSVQVLDHTFVLETH